MAVTIKQVRAASPAAQIGLKAGDTLLAVDGNDINDMLDYEFYTAKAEFALEILTDGQHQSLWVTKQEYQPFGCDFETYLIDKQHCCCNKCIFCFVDQLPCGLRETMYFKDDDERLSFLYGNYITLTNLSQKEADRIANMHISPINISVHTVEPELRVEMMKNKNAGKVLQYIDQFAAAGIEMNFQIVLCPGWNDGEHLRKSLEKLTAYYPACKSVAVVPVGVTRYREKLPHLDTFQPDTAAKEIDQIEQIGCCCLEKYGERLVYPSDEFFLIADREIPPEEYYGDYPQIENGVGMMRLLQEEFSSTLATTPRRRLPRKADLVTGESAYPLLCKLAQACMDKNPAVKLKVHCVKNEFFGGNVSVAGLLTGQDLIAQLKGKLCSRELLFPRVMLRAQRDLFLDDVSLPQLSRELGGVGLRVVETDGKALLAAMLGRGKRDFG